jgi:hypothetical protein
MCASLICGPRRHPARFGLGWHTATVEAPLHSTRERGGCAQVVACAQAQAVGLRPTATIGHATIGVAP